jgi:hypothetical protein
VSHELCCMNNVTSAMLHVVFHFETLSLANLIVIMQSPTCLRSCVGRWSHCNVSTKSEITVNFWFGSRKMGSSSAFLVAIRSTLFMSPTKLTLILICPRTQKTRGDKTFPPFAQNNLRRLQSATQLNDVTKVGSVSFPLAFLNSTSCWNVII